MKASSFVAFRYKGLAIAFLILSSWVAHLVYCLTSVPLAPEAIPHVLIQTFLSVGLFITAHDAMHRSVAPHHQNLNDFVGALALFLYAGFLYNEVRPKHFAHHAHPVTDDDPDYAPNDREAVTAWLWRFATNYYSWKNFAIMHLHVGTAWLLSGSFLKVLIFYAVPAWLSAMQLFYFGTYLPHRTPKGGHTDHHKARSNDFPPWLSFLTCYHFGYHAEHHNHPQVPWWRLSKLRALLQASDKSSV